MEDMGVQMEKFGVTTQNAAKKIPTLVTQFEALQLSARTLQDDIKKKSFSSAGFEPATHGILQPLQSIALPTELQGGKILPAGLEPAASA